MKQIVNITSDGIRSILKNYTPKLAIAEFIWNGFDAKANTVHFNYKANDLGWIEYIEIVDNGYGINFEELDVKFKTFHSSEKKAIDTEANDNKHISTTHGKNGVGRLTFFSFAHNANWSTVFQKEGHFFSGEIQISTENLNSFVPSSTQKVSDSETSTSVRFTNLQIDGELIETEVIPFLKTEFCWFLELNKLKNYQIIINGEPLDYSSLIEDSEDFIIKYNKTFTAFSCRYIQWNEKPHKELSKFYFINNSDEEVYKDFTTLNKKGDDFFHSVYIKSHFFEGFDYKTNENSGLMNLFSGSKNSTEYRFLISELNNFLRSKRKPFLRLSAERLFNKYEEDGIFPQYRSIWETTYKKPVLEETLIGLYEAQPKLFVSLNNDQKKIFVRFLDLLLDSDERDHIFKILEEVIDLDEEEKANLANLLQTTKLDRIISTIKLIEDRYKTISELKELLFNSEIKANEVNHLQTMIENHYWIFGEQYHLVTAAEPKFEEALRRYIYLLTDKDVKREIEHPHRLKEMDIFACRQNRLNDRIENIVVELKHPNIKLGTKQYNQVYNYLDVIIKQPEFNAPNMYWEFYLVGCDFDSSDFIKNLIQTNKPHGIPSLIQNLENGRIKIFAKKWSEIFTDFEIKHNFLSEKLQFERQKLTQEFINANEVVELAISNSATQPQEVIIG